MSARRAAPWLLGLAICLSGAAAGCGDPAPEIGLSVSASWKDEPPTVDQTGYHLLISISWPSRLDSCASLADVRVTANDHVSGPIVAGDCQTGFQARLGPFTEDAPVTVRLRDGDTLLGEATFEGLFPGAGAVGLVSPAGGRANPGEPVVMSVPAGSVRPDLVYVDFYWMETPASVPPFHTFANATAGPDGTTVETIAPTLTGRAWAIVKTAALRAGQVTDACRGFVRCDYVPIYDTLGPVPVEIVP